MTEEMIVKFLLDKKLVCDGCNCPLMKLSKLDQTITQHEVYWRKEEEAEEEEEEEERKETKTKSNYNYKWLVKFLLDRKINSVTMNFLNIRIHITIISDWWNFFWTEKLSVTVCIF
jgi:hypothetical protein